MKIRLMGNPAVTDDDGNILPVRGLQSWAVLARVLLSPRPLSRRQIAAELFPETVDPLGSLRWCLASLRRALGAETLTGDPVVANLPAGIVVDALCLDDPAFDPLTAGDLLEDSAPAASGAEFETWLLVERARLAAQLDARLRRDALDTLANQGAEKALLLARYAVQRQPFDEGAHVLLIRALVMAGHVDAARQHAFRVEEEFQRELGLASVPALHSAARGRLSDPPSGPGPEMVVKTLLQAGTAALNVGAIDAGLDCLRRAAHQAQTLDDLSLQAQALAELGAALIHSVRGQDDEGIVHLSLAEELALKSQERAVACRAVTELSYADALAGRRPDAQRLAKRALALADDDPARLATAHAFAGFNLADWGRFDEADQAYAISLAAARDASDLRRHGWALGLGAWGKLRSGRADQAIDWAEQCIDTCAQLEWLSFRPWPETVLAEAQLACGADPSWVRSSVQPALAMAGQLADPCWGAAACRVVALTHEKEAREEEALHWLTRAAEAFQGVSDPYAALQVRILFDRTRLTLSQDAEAGQSLLRQLLVAAARLHAETEMDQALSLRATARTV
ncbi:hypothetical protein ACSBLW_09955 [Thioclava sp. FR2]|uniref:hypothetical protein n=1 Tax=Thioclava sp. FR2 TaxID=3445780 RepID=UPI003EBAC148